LALWLESEEAKDCYKKNKKTQRSSCGFWRFVVGLFIVIDQLYAAAAFSRIRPNP
jgi:hypothetical protein